MSSNEADHAHEPSPRAQPAPGRGKAGIGAALIAAAVGVGAADVAAARTADAVEPAPRPQIAEGAAAWTPDALAERLRRLRQALGPEAAGPAAGRSRLAQFSNWCKENCPL